MARALARHDYAAPSVRELDWLMGAVIGLCCLGLVMAVSILGPEVGALGALREQGTKLFVGVVVLLVAAYVPLGWYARIATPLLAVTVVLCAATLFFHDVKGASRWLRVGPLSLQPVDLARFALILYGARWVAARGDRVRGFTTGFVPMMAPAALLSVILVLQPDVGNAAFSLAIAAVMALVAGVRLIHFVLVGLPLLLPMLYWVSTHSHVQQRLTGFLHVETGSQVWQSLVAISSGGVFGRGLGDGWMKMGFVAEAENDFVFAIVGEELGLLGGLGVLALYVTIGVVGIRLFLRMQEPFHRMLVLGFTFAICMQAAINLMVVTGMAPAKGIDLPFLSSGGTNLVFSLAAIGIIGNAARSDPGLDA